MNISNSPRVWTDLDIRFGPQMKNSFKSIKILYIYIYVLSVILNHYTFFIYTTNGLQCLHKIFIFISLIILNYVSFVCF